MSPRCGRLAAAVLVTLLAACAPDPEAPLVGEWSHPEDGTVVLAEGGRLELRARNGVTFTGTWRLEGDSLLRMETGPFNQTAGIVRITDDALVLRSRGVEMTYTAAGVDREEVMARGEEARGEEARGEEARRERAPASDPLGPMRRSLEELLTAQEIHYAMTDYRYADSAEELDRWEPQPGVTVEILEASDVGWSAVATDRTAEGRCAVFVGTASPPSPATVQGRVDCEEG